MTDEHTEGLLPVMQGASLWKPASPEIARIGWPYDFAEIEAVRDLAVEAAGYDATLEVVAGVMQIADQRLATLSRPPSTPVPDDGEAERGFNLAIRTLRAWSDGFTRGARAKVWLTLAANDLESNRAAILRAALTKEDRNVTGG